ncbi:MAG: immunity 22 family protein [Chthoniobacter sp.]|nr:immunity 22 family protein [Chthoniobacter sp.]
MPNEYEVIDIWIGYFPSEAECSEYLAETYDDDDAQPISRFAADMRQTFYDHDFVEHSFQSTPSRDLSLSLTHHSFSASYTPAAVAAFSETATGPFNTLLLVWGSQITQPVSVHRDAYWLHHLGTFNCDPRA